jgi:hypothetical protein
MRRPPRAGCGHGVPPPPRLPPRPRVPPGASSQRPTSSRWGSSPARPPRRRRARSAPTLPSPTTRGAGAASRRARRARRSAPSGTWRRRDARRGAAGWQGPNRGRAPAGPGAPAPHRPARRRRPLRPPRGPPRSGAPPAAQRRRPPRPRRRRRRRRRSCRWARPPAAGARRHAAPGVWGTRGARWRAGAGAVSGAPGDEAAGSGGATSRLRQRQPRRPLRLDRALGDPRRCRTWCAALVGAAALAAASAGAAAAASARPSSASSAGRRAKRGCAMCQVRRVTAGRQARPAWRATACVRVAKTQAPAPSRGSIAAGAWMDVLCGAPRVGSGRHTQGGRGQPGRRAANRPKVAPIAGAIGLAIAIGSQGQALNSPGLERRARRAWPGQACGAAHPPPPVDTLLAAAA